MNNVSFAFRVFFGAYLTQRIPALLLTLVIAFAAKPVAARSASGTVTDEPSSFADNEGPSRKARLLVLLAAICCVCGDAPLSLWALALGPGCVFWLASWVDLLHIVYIIGLILYFCFVRLEYLRLMEEGERCIQCSMCLFHCKS